jgi:molybdopterin molybdotransferase
VGDHDFVQAAFKACGVKIDFWKIAMRPGKPFMYGRKGKTHVMGLPGNPVSALITARLFMQPLLETLLGLPQHTHLATAKLDGSLPANDERQDYVRAQLSTAADGTRTATPLALQDSSMQRALQQSDVLIVRAPHAAASASGCDVQILPITF